jgi:hypothetical protein
MVGGWLSVDRFLFSGWRDIGQSTCHLTVNGHGRQAWYEIGEKVSQSSAAEMYVELVDDVVSRGVEWSGNDGRLMDNAANEKPEDTR